MTSLQTGMHYPIDLEALPPTWDKGYVGDFAFEIQPGFACGKHNKEGRGIPHIRPYNIDRSGKLDLSEIKAVAPDADTKRLHSGDVLFNNTNSPELIGKTTVISAAGEWGFSNHMTRVAFPDTVSPKFAAYQLHYLWSRGYFLHNCVKHVNQASVSSTTLARAVPFVKPPRPQQDCIVAEIEKQFSRLDEAVTNLKRVKANLKRYKASVLKAAVEGKLTKEWRKRHPDVEPASKLLERILAESSANSLDWSGLVNLPPSWCWSRIEDIGDVQLGRQRAPRYHSGPNMRAYLRVQNVFEDRIDLEDVMEMDFPPADFEKFRLSPGDILLNEGQSPELLGRPAIYRGELPDACFTNTLIRFRVNVLMTPNYPFIVFRAYMRNRRFTKEGTITTNIAHLSAGRFAKIEFPLPPLEEQEEIVAEVERRLSIIDELEAAVEANLTRADRLRQAVLAIAFSGRLLAGSPISARSPINRAQY